MTGTDPEKKRQRAMTSVGLVGLLVGLGTAIGATALMLNRGGPLSPPTVQEAEADEGVGEATPPAADTGEEGAVELAEDTASATDAPPQPTATFCQPDVIGADDGCAEVIGGTVPVLKDRLTDEPVTLTSPDGQRELKVSTCDEFGQLAQGGWYAQTTAEMRRQDTFERACGLLALASTVRGPGQEVLPLTTATLNALPDGELPGTEEAAGAPWVFEQEGETPPVWRGSNDAFLGDVILVSTANFDKDPEAEHLIALSTRAKGGSLSSFDYALIETDRTEPTLTYLDPF